jgi:hypothetical protein
MVNILALRANFFLNFNSYTSCIKYHNKNKIKMPFSNTKFDVEFNILIWTFIVRLITPEQLWWHERTCRNEHHPSTLIPHQPFYNQSLQHPLLRRKYLYCRSKKFRLQWWLQTSRYVISLGGWICRIWRDSLAPTKVTGTRISTVAHSPQLLDSTWRARTASFDYVWHVTFELQRAACIILIQDTRLSIEGVLHPPSSVWRCVLIPKAAADLGEALLKGN